ncbi:hypothetical protein ACG2DA_04615 [Alienimonas sp. DA493]
MDARRADRLRTLPSVPHEPRPVASPFSEHFENDVLPLLDLPRGRKAREAAACALADLYAAANAGRATADGRDTRHSGTKARVRAWDALVAAGLVLKRTGSERAGKTTRYGLTFRGERLRRAQHFTLTDLIDVTPAPPASTARRGSLPSRFAPVVLHDADGNPRRWPRLDRYTAAEVREVEEAVIRLNDANLNHAWKIYRDLDGRPVPDQPNVVVRAIYNEDFKHGGRLYSSTANAYNDLPRAVRRTMRIDGEPIAELDYSGFHPRALYHYGGHEFRGDVYQPARVLPAACPNGDAPAAVRKGVKVATNILLNAATRKAAVGAAVQDEAIGRSPEFRAALETCGVGVGDMLDAIKRAHAPIARHFHTGAGLRLQRLDVQLMLAVLGRFVDEGKPALGLHDAVLCRVSDAEFAAEVMAREYRKVFGGDAEITRAWPPCSKHP